MAVRVFTRFFEDRGTVLLEGAQPLFRSIIRPERGDLIIEKDGSVSQVQVLRNRLVERTVEGPPKPIKLPQSWYAVSVKL